MAVLIYVFPGIQSIRSEGGMHGAKQTYEQTNAPAYHLNGQWDLEQGTNTVLLHSPPHLISYMRSSNPSPHSGTD